MIRTRPCPDMMPTRHVEELKQLVQGLYGDTADSDEMTFEEMGQVLAARDQARLRALQLCTNCQRPMLSKRLSWARKPYLGLVYVPSRPRHFARSCPRPVCMRYNCALGAAPPRATRVTLGASESPFFSTYGNFNTARATGEVHACRKH